MKISLSIIFLLLLSISQWACTGATIKIKADNLNYPVSMTKGVLTERLSLVEDSYGYDVIDDFSFTISRVTTGWTLLSFGFFSFGPTEDISDKLNEIIKEKGGDAVVDLQVNKNPVTTIVNFASGTLSGLFGTLGVLFLATDSKKNSNPSTALLATSVLMPGYMLIHVEGKVIKYK